ncbi:MAG: undecaprenyl-diphosphate phosphatase [bacterium]|nr:MAG: undecaprenyl-diphosphate phosphatase [bacterium]
MNDVINAFLLGVLQGLTEFLPVSSSGHLVIVRSLMPEFVAPPEIFDVLLHGGTLIALGVYFKRDLAGITSDIVHRQRRGLHLPLMLFVASIPVGVVGFFWADTVTPLFSSPRVASFGLIGTSVLLASAARFGRGERTMGQMQLWQAFAVGCFQAFAVIPGVSRSGATISLALILGFSGTESARFSFLLSIPAILGIVAVRVAGLGGSGMIGIYLVGAIAAAVSGWLSIALLMRVLLKRRLLPFTLYCFALGSFSLVFLV